MPTLRPAIRANGAAIRAIRLASGKTVTQCAEQAGVNQATWSKWELGVRRIGPANFRKVLETLALDDRNAILAIPEAQ